jgi:hypothetical protein
MRAVDTNVLVLYLVRTSESDLVVSGQKEQTATRTIPRTEIIEVTASRSNALRNTLIGVGAGFGLGAALGCTRGSDSYEAVCGSTLIVFGGIGTWIGAGTGFGSRWAVVVYRAP